MASGNYYDLLEIPKTATREQIRKAYRSKAKLYHPDVNSRSNSNMHFLLIAQAYETLIDPQKRHVYDAMLFTDKEPMLSYAQWKEIERQKIKEYEEQQLNIFIQKRTRFQQSGYYKPAYFLLYIGTCFNFLFSIALLAGCGWLMWTLHPMIIFILLPFISFAIYILLATPKWFQEAKRYF